MAKRATRRKKPAPAGHFSPELFAFLRALKRRNDRNWFLANKPRYEEHVKESFLDFISDFAPKLAAVSPELVADARSMFRIYRDTRFSKDKTPYKTHASAHFQHTASAAAPRGESVHAPGYYLHLEPGSVFLAGGLWRPPTDIANRIRRAIVADPAGWTRAAGGKAFAKLFRLEGDSLSRPPRGFDPEHALIAHLKRKDFIATSLLSEKDACSSDFLDVVLERCRALAPMMRFLSRAVGLPF